MARPPHAPIQTTFHATLQAALHRVVTLAKREFCAVLLDRKSRAQIFVAPFVMLTIFSFAVTMEVKNASLGVLNLDAGELGRQFVSRLASGPTFTRVFNLGGEQEIAPTIENQRALAVLSIPADFSRRLLSGRPATVQTILDGRKINAVQIADGYVRLVARQFGSSADRRSIASSAPRLEIVTRQLFNPNLEYLWFTLPLLMVLLTQMIALIVSGMSVARERELGTFEQLLVSPLSSVEIVIGKAVPAVCLASCEGVVIYCIARFVFGVPFEGSLPLLALGFGIFILAVTGVGLFVSSLCGTQQQAFLGCFMYMVPATLLSGFVAPIENMPPALQYLTLLNPARHVLTISLGVYLKGLPPGDVIPELAWLSGIAAATLTFAGWFFKRRTQ
ncbi:MAG: ABC transporter permease [Synergistaceae bacterium]|jgi:ABC-2 type transport system permease protein|nr:ABC transporter permease [Synergistaceae bacterium]